MELQTRSADGQRQRLPRLVIEVKDDGMRRLVEVPRSGFCFGGDLLLGQRMPLCS